MKELEVDIQKHLGSFSLDLRFTMGEGCLAILGASGSGKTMTLRAIAGINTPDRGRVAFGERVFFDRERRIDLPPQQRRVGYLFQNYALFPNMTVEENITAGLGRLPAAQKREIAARQVTRFRLEGLEARRPAQLSGGQQQRVALARIFACDPELLLLDEPFSALDSHLREELLLELEETLADYRGTAVLVTHSREEAYRLSRRLLVLDGGRCSALGETKAVFRDPGTAQAARLTGCRNILPARKAGELLVEVPAWGLTLETARPVPEELTHIGIQAHRLRPAGEGEKNRIPTGPSTVVEGPVRWEVLCHPGKDGSCPLWWVPGEEPRELPKELAVSPEDVLLLR